MRMKAVPEQDHWPLDVMTKMSEEADDLRGADCPGMRHQKHTAALRRSHTIGQGSDHGEMVPASETVGQDRRLPARRPRASDRRSFGEAALVEEDERRSPACGVFFSAGHVVFTQRSIASSSRSRARVVGFCSDQPS